MVSSVTPGNRWRRWRHSSPGRVIYCGTFAKSLFPSLRLAFLAAPPALANALVRAKWLCDLGSSALLQHTLAQLMSTGEYDRHIRRMQKQYRGRRHVLLGRHQAAPGRCRRSGWRRGGPARGRLAAAAAGGPGGTADR